MEVTLASHLYAKMDGVPVKPELQERPHAGVSLDIDADSGDAVFGNTGGLSWADMAAVEGWEPPQGTKMHAPTRPEVVRQVAQLHDEEKAKLVHRGLPTYLVTEVVVNGTATVEELPALYGLQGSGRFVVDHGCVEKETLRCDACDIHHFKMNFDPWMWDRDVEARHICRACTSLYLCHQCDKVKRPRHFSRKERGRWMPHREDADGKVLMRGRRCKACIGHTSASGQTGRAQVRKPPDAGQNLELPVPRAKEAAAEDEAAGVEAMPPSRVRMRLPLLRRRLPRRRLLLPTRMMKLRKMLT